MKKIVAIGILVIGLLTVMSIHPVAGEVIWDETPQVPVDYYVGYSAIIDEGTELMVSITTDGNPVDVFLMESGDHDEYVSFMNEEREDFHYYVDGSATSVVQKAYSFTIPHTDRWYIVIDNALTEIEGEADAGVPVNVHVKVTTSTPSPTPTPTPTSTPSLTPTLMPTVTPGPTPTPTPETPGFEAISAIAGLLAIAYLLGRRK